jgi:hypothetical protein
LLNGCLLAHATQIKIQAIQRGKQVRKTQSDFDMMSVQGESLELASQTAAATQIQAVHRGKVVRAAVGGAQPQPEAEPEPAPEAAPGPAPEPEPEPATEPESEEPELTVVATPPQTPVELENRLAFSPTPDDQAETFAMPTPTQPAKGVVIDTGQNYKLS